MEQSLGTKKSKMLKALVLTLGLLAIGLTVYLLGLPIYPSLKYQYLHLMTKGGNSDFQDLAQAARETEQAVAGLPVAEKNDSLNRVVIPKIGVNAPIIESKNSAYGLSKGAWHVPESSTPDKGGNTVVTAHRFKYLPPNNLTFFLLDKLEKGDIVSLIWSGKEYYYKVKEKKIVPPMDLTILEPSLQPILTLFTCDPIFSEKNRLVIVSEFLR